MESARACILVGPMQLLRCEGAMIRAHEDKAVLTVDVDGSATMMESPAVHSFANTELARGVRSLRIDLRDCTTMDSTFSGTLLSLKRRLDAVGGTLTLVSPSPRVVELLREMGLDDFYAIDMADPSAGPWTEVHVAQPRVETLEDRILDAHEELSRIPAAGTRGFGAVVEELHRDGGRRDGEDHSIPQPKISCAPRSDHFTHLC